MFQAPRPERSIYPPGRFLDTDSAAGYTKFMKTILTFDFGTDEEAAQQARHRVEGWKQSFRLGDKLALRFERNEAADSAADEPGSGKAEARKSAVKKDDDARGVGEGKAASASGAGVRVAVLLHFSPHEKLSYQRWLERVPTEEPFTSVPHEVVSAGEEKFAATVEWFDSLENAAPARRARQ
jgi:hypothetical protein